MVESILAVTSVADDRTTGRPLFLSISFLTKGDLTRAKPASFAGPRLASERSMNHRPLSLGLALSLLSVSACGGSGGQPCPGGCPATSATATVAVSTTPAMALSDVQATLTGPETGTMSCQPNLSASLCEWPPVPVTPGTYTLQVSAPGYQPVIVPVQVTVSPPTCGCTFGSITPSTVSLSPVDGG